MTETPHTSNPNEPLTPAANTAPVYVQPANDPAKAADSVATRTATPPEIDSKMVGGGEELRDHDFPVPNENGSASNYSRVTDVVPKPQAHEVRSGGIPGELPGDEQKVGQTPSIMDQNTAEPQDIGTSASDVTPFH